MEGCSKTLICSVLGVSRFSIYWKPKARDVTMKSGYKKKEDDLILEEIKEVLRVRSSYGYKRVTAMVNKFRLLKGFRVLNKKRIYRIMKRNGLIFESSKRLCCKDKGEGKVMTLFSNTRWCSDCFEIKCFNGERVYVSFVIDCHDRQCLSYIAKSSPILAIDIQDLMLKSVENRFGLKMRVLNREIEFLTDRGSVYRSKETIEFGRYLGLRSCFTAPYSPQSNGMAEAFVKTIKRDYVYTSDCFSAKSVCKMFKNWIFDYNNVAPHSALDMKSPVEYRKLANQCV